MMYHAYTVYDRKSLQYNPPFFMVADGAAVRAFQELANDPETSVGRHPGDYVLYRVGDYDDASGQLLPGTPTHVSDALPLVRVQAALPFDRPLRSDAVSNGSAADPVPFKE